MVRSEKMSKIFKNIVAVYESGKGLKEVSEEISNVTIFKILYTSGQHSNHFHYA